MRKKNDEEHKLRVYRDQLITVGDLETFKNDLIQEIKTVLGNAGTIAPTKKWLKSSEVKKLPGISTGTL